MRLTGLENLNFILSYLGSNRTLAVGVSGGADSLYLTLLLHQWCQQNDVSLVALTVDHKLRPESSEEAKWLKSFLRSYNILHETLPWQHLDVETKIQEQARAARYALLINYCKLHNITAICMAHHLEDQWETFMMRLAHGSGSAGLGAMSSVSTKDSIFIFRPLLQTSKTQIISELRKFTSIWIEDPSNQNDHYERIQFRNKYKNFEQLGLSSTNIQKSITKLQQEGKALDFYAKRFLSEHITVDGLGYAYCNFNEFQKLPSATQYRVAVRTGTMIGGLFESYPPRVRTVKNLLKTLPKTTTCMGCLWTVREGNLYTIREPNRATQETFIHPNEIILWDNRLLVRSSFGGVLKTLGQKGWLQVKKQLSEVPPIPVEAIYSSVALWNGEKVTRHILTENYPAILISFIF